MCQSSPRAAANSCTGQCSCGAAPPAAPQRSDSPAARGCPGGSSPGRRQAGDQNRIPSSGGKLNMKMLQVGWIWVWLLLDICNLFALSLVVSLPCLLVFKKQYREELLPLEQQALSPASTAVPSFVISSMETSAQAECPELLDGSVRLWRVLHRSDTEVPRVFVTQTPTGCTGGTCCTHSPAAPAGYSYTRKFLLYFQ